MKINKVVMPHVHVPSNATINLAGYIIILSNPQDVIGIIIKKGNLHSKEQSPA
jgi:hypothetical protein